MPRNMSFGDRRTDRFHRTLDGRAVYRFDGAIHPLAMPRDENGTPMGPRFPVSEQARARRTAARADSARRRADRDARGGSARRRRLAAKHGAAYRGAA